VPSAPCAEWTTLISFFETTCSFNCCTIGQPPAPLGDANWSADNGAILANRARDNSPFHAEPAQPSARDTLYCVCAAHNGRPECMAHMKHRSGRLELLLPNSLSLNRPFGAQAEATIDCLMERGEGAAKPITTSCFIHSRDRGASLFTIGLKVGDSNPSRSYASLSVCTTSRSPSRSSRRIWYIRLKP